MRRLDRRFCGLKRVIRKTVTRCRTANGHGFLSVTVHCTSYIYQGVNPGRKRLIHIPNRRVTRVTLTGLCLIAKSHGCLSRTGFFLSGHKCAAHHSRCDRTRGPIVRRSRTMKRTIHTACVCTKVTSITTLANSATCIGTVKHV